MALSELLGQLNQVKAKLDADYGKALDRIFRPDDAAPGAGHSAIIELGAKIILTTNYDQLLEHVEGPPVRGVHVGHSAANALKDIHAGRSIIFKVHGTVELPQSVVLTLAEYQEAHRSEAYHKVLDFLLTTNSFIFIGYGMEDSEDLDLILEDNAKQLATANSLHYALLQRLSDPHSEAKRADRLRRTYRVKVVPYNDHSEVVPFIRALARVPTS